MEAFEKPSESEISNEDLGDEEIDQYEPTPDGEEKEHGFEDHYLKTPPKHLRGYLYGYNYQSIVYPFSDSPEQQRVWVERMGGVVNIPSKLIPEFDADERCKHNNAYNGRDDTLCQESKNLCLFNDLGERIFNTQVFARPTVGPCSCLQRFDGSPLLIWNLGKARIEPNVD